MKAAFGAEAIGLGYEMASTNLLNSLPREIRREVADLVGLPVRGGRVADPVNPRPWVAEIVGTHPRFRYQRMFLPYRIDYSRSSSTGNRGVWFWWTIESGHVYETRYRTSWEYGRAHRFLTVTDDGDVRDLTQEEVQAWLGTRSG